MKTPTIRLTEYQIRAMISRLESAEELYTKQHKFSAAVRSRMRLVDYRIALAVIQGMPEEDRQARHDDCTSGKKNANQEIGVPRGVHGGRLR
jgi:hypothetical protein